MSATNMLINLTVVSQQFSNAVSMSEYNNGEREFKTAEEYYEESDLTDQNAYYDSID